MLGAICFLVHFGSRVSLRHKTSIKILVAPLTAFVRCSFRCLVCYSVLLLRSSIYIRPTLFLCRFGTCLRFNFSPTLLRRLRHPRYFDFLSPHLLRRLRRLVYSFLLPSDSDCVWAFIVSDPCFGRYVFNLQNKTAPLRGVRRPTHAVLQVECVFICIFVCVCSCRLCLLLKTVRRRQFPHLYQFSRVPCKYIRPGVETI